MAEPDDLLEAARTASTQKPPADLPEVSTSDALLARIDPGEELDFGWLPQDLADIANGNVEPEMPAVLARTDGEFLLYPGRIGLITGETESLKTWLALLAVKQEIEAGHHVVFIDFEDSPGLIVGRLRDLGVAPQAIIGSLTYVAPRAPFGPLVAEMFRRLFKERGTPSLVVIDATTGAMAAEGLDPNTGQDVDLFYGPGRLPGWLALQGPAVNLIDHVTKSTEGRGRWAIGSERKISGATGSTFRVEIVTPFGRGKTGRANVFVTKDRLGAVEANAGAKRLIGQLEMTSWPDGGITATLQPPEVSTNADGTFRPTFLMEKLAAAIEETPGLSKNALRAKVTGKNDFKDLALELLVAEGFVRVERGQRGASQHHPIRPFTGSKGGGDSEEF